MKNVFHNWPMGFISLENVTSQRKGEFMVKNKTKTKPEMCMNRPSNDSVLAIVAPCRRHVTWLGRAYFARSLRTRTLAAWSTSVIRRARVCFIQLSTYRVVTSGDTVVFALSCFAVPTYLMSNVVAFGL